MTLPIIAIVFQPPDLFKEYRNVGRSSVRRATRQTLHYIAEQNEFANSFHSGKAAALDRAASLARRSCTLAGVLGRATCNEQ